MWEDLKLLLLLIMITVVIIVIIKTRNDEIIIQDSQSYVRSDWVYGVITTVFPIYSQSNVRYL